MNDRHLTLCEFYHKYGVPATKNHDLTIAVNKCGRYPVQLLWARRPGALRVFSPLFRFPFSRRSVSWHNPDI